MPAIAYEVVAATSETPDIRRIVMKPISPIPVVWRAGAHIRVNLPEGGDRAYSLLRLPKMKAGHLAVGVLREPNSHGGSKYMHSLKAGDWIRLNNPANHFEVEDHDGPCLLIAGGIGITPILSMASDLSRTDREFEVHYGGRAEGALAFVPEMQEICGDRLNLHYDDQPNRMNLVEILENAPDNSHVYFCGPRGMVEAIISITENLGWDDERVHFEVFAANADTSGDTAFDIQIRSTGQVVKVASDKTIVEALEEAGLDPLYDCQRGDCGICQCKVHEGEPEHRDVVLTKKERSSNSKMQICVSRSKSPKLVIDI
ncbi:ferredoxin [Ruegeria sp. ANG-R]|uniref:PDR/VanB family oxidoreductase n=1 Tax=Ruegeria sp. ANG-R TaxID=1577903 RepID=UPI00057E4418|nr:PDR/VanB family oxidoreductase [Ruegeria sp. ANG-R]KIC38987.1 ferredoxin [Ruegeria sp. ANG-R]